MQPARLVCFGQNAGLIGQKNFVGAEALILLHDVQIPVESQL